MKADRAQARAMWQAVADAEFNRETLHWIANVACAVLRADDEENDNDRRGEVLRAVGLFGRYDAERDAIRSIVSGIDHTCDLIERGNRFVAGRPLKRGERAHLRREAVANTLGIEEAPGAIDKRIARALGQ